MVNLCKHTVNSMPISDLDYLQNLRKQIENQISWGDSQDWTNYDFEKLSGEIEAKTKVVLSVTTLKRIWGKVKSNHSPATTTLNTLAQYLNYSDWRGFKQNTEISKSEIDDIEEIIENNFPNSEEKAKKSFTSIIVLILAVIAFGIFLFAKNKNVKLNPEDFKFEANKILTKGVPNSVIFTYNASKAKTDSVYIVQTWDIRRKTLVPKNGKNHSAIYYYPGYFRSKLIIDSTIVQTHDIQIATDGWLCLVETENQPIYFKKGDAEKEGVIAVDEELLAKYKIENFPKSPMIRFFNQRDLGELMTSDFTFETTLKNEVNQETNACQQVQVLIQCKDNIIIVPIVSKQCVGETFFGGMGFGINSKLADLSKFGADLQQWTHLKVVGKGKTMKFYVNGAEAYSINYPNDPAGIVGLQYRFNGAGAVKETRFTSKNGVIKF